MVSNYPKGVLCRQRGMFSAIKRIPICTRVFKYLVPPTQDPALCMAESTFSSQSPKPKNSLQIKLPMFYPMAMLFPLFLPSQTLPAVPFQRAEQSPSSSSQHPRLYLGQDTLSCHFRVIHEPEKDPGCFREGMHEALSDCESLLCQMLILHQKHVSLVF